ncbi:YeiH family protein [Jiangella alba]|uniref:Conserved hypothetical integral membrane protein n=1 Tax=Jiangella alba TaxID=561176 RepID=A0A1H5L780_9ACTN|nr:putative sulfate exporter family transporter [Jiangella alba]SEE72932.1 conserved hypothetical integral membrane protein [Jiangella alba]
MTSQTIGVRVRAFCHGTGSGWTGRWAGVVAALAAAAVAVVLALLVPFASAIVLAVLGGIAAGPVVPMSWRAGLAWSARVLLRLGVVLLGLHLSVREVFALGRPTLLAVVATVLVGMGATILAGAVLGVSRPATLLIAAGTSICGASAVAAMAGAIRARSEEIAAAIAMVTLYGTASIVLIPWLAGLLGLDGPSLGAWAGIAVHEVAQVVAASSPAGSAALTVAVVVKLTRVILLAPVVAVASIVVGRSTRHATRPPLVPLFVVLFVAAVAARSLGVVPGPVIAWSPAVTSFLLTAALFALGTTVQLRRLLREGRRAMLLGAIATAVVTGSGLGLLTVAGATSLGG